MKFSLREESIDKIIDALEPSMRLMLSLTTDVDKAYKAISKAIENVLSDDEINMTEYLDGLMVGDDALSTWQEELGRIGEALCTSVKNIGESQGTPGELDLHIKSKKIAFNGLSEISGLFGSSDLSGLFDF